MQHVPKQLNPNFGRMFDFEITLPHDNLLEVAVWDYDLLGTDSLIGETKVHHISLNYSTEVRAWGGGLSTADIRCPYLYPLSIGRICVLILKLFTYFHSIRSTWRIVSSQSIVQRAVCQNVTKPPDSISGGIRSNQRQSCSVCARTTNFRAHIFNLVTAGSRIGYFVATKQSTMKCWDRRLPMSHVLWLLCITSI